MQRVVVLYGGRSGEHSISCLSARSALAAIDRTRYEVLPVGVTRDGRWTLTTGDIPVTDEQPLPHVDDDGPTVALVATRIGPLLVEIDDQGNRVASHGAVDVVLPLLHGPWGEDGTIQGLLATVGVAYVGADVSASALGIDKAAMKALFAANGLPQTAYVCVNRARWAQDATAVTEELRQRLDLPWFVKPARQGSSLGISKVDTVDDLAAAVTEALGYDDTVVIEEGVAGARELEIGVLGDAPPQVTGPGEIVPAGEFYDFTAKYLDASELVVPAEVTEQVSATLKSLALAAYHAIGCRGMARVDFFVVDGSTVLVNEINTIPGFTPRSMYPRLWAHEGLSYQQLVDRLLASARR